MTARGSRTLRAGLLALALVTAGGAAGPGPTLAPHSSAVVARAASSRVEVDAVQWSAARRTSGSYSARGYTYLASTIAGETPAGFGVWVDSRAAHHWVMGRYSSSSATALSKLGIRIKYRGYGRPAAKEGVVRVLEGKKGCGSNSSTVGMTWTYWNGLPDGKSYVTHADVYLCPRLFRLGTWATQATVGHELGHAMGLGHVSNRYQGSYQLMNPTVRRNVLTYRTGDRSGLAKLARATAAIRSDIPPTGKLDKSSFTDAGNIEFTGWALLKYAKADPIRIVVTDNGTPVAQSGTPVARADVNSQYDPGERTHGYDLSVPWPGGRHEYCVRATSSKHPSATAQLGCVTWTG
jgi:hypothetical protein